MADDECFLYAPLIVAVRCEWQHADDDDELRGGNTFVTLCQNMRIGHFVVRPKFG